MLIVLLVLVLLLWGGGTAFSIGGSLIHLLLVLALVLAILELAGYYSRRNIP